MLLRNFKKEKLKSICRAQFKNPSHTKNVNHKRMQVLKFEKFLITPSQTFNFCQTFVDKVT